MLYTDDDSISQDDLCGSEREVSTIHKIWRAGGKNSHRKKGNNEELTKTNNKNLMWLNVWVMHICFDGVKRPHESKNEKSKRNQGTIKRPSPPARKLDRASFRKTRCLQRHLGESVNHEVFPISRAPDSDADRIQMFSPL